MNGKQCTIVWHVDDLRLSHVEEEAVNDMIERLNKEFGGRESMTVSEGKIHDYLGIMLDYRTKGPLKVDMISYIYGTLEEVPKDMKGHAVTLVASYLFKVNTNDPVLLSRDRKELFHHVTMQLAYLARCVRPDICTSIAFLQMCVTKPDEDDYN